MTEQFNPFANTNASIANLADAATGNSSFAVPETNVYGATLQYAYMEAANTPGNHNLVLRWKLSNGYEFTETLYSVLVNGSPYKGTDDKGQPKLTYGFGVATRYFVTMFNKSLEQAYLNMVDKIINVYDYNLKKDVPRTVKAFADSIGVTGFMAFQRKIENKTAKDESGSYVPTAERTTKAVNVFTTNPAKQTFTEIRDNKEPTKLDEWESKNKGKDYDAYKPVAGASNTTSNTNSSPAMFNFA